MTPLDDDGDVFVRPFVDFLREVHGGRSANELARALHDLTLRVQDTRKKGTLTYVITLEPVKDVAGDALTVTDEIKLKLPEHNRGASLFWPNEDGNLVRTNPNQLQFESLEVVKAADEVVERVDIETGEIIESAGMK